MVVQRQIRWKIDGDFTAETMPLSRLADYLKELATMLGQDKALHLIRVDSSSAVPVINVDDVAAELVYRRAEEIRSGMAPPFAMQSYRKINKMLREDKATATIYENDAEIIPFPGRYEPEPIITGLQEQGTIEGTLEKIGGSKEWVPVHIKMGPNESAVTGFYARRAVAKELGHHLFAPIRVFGRGKWTRMPDGKWIIERFNIDTFEPLDATPLIDVVAALRSVQADWPSDPLVKIRELRNDPDEAE
jgi:hypothetical protein